MELQYEAFGTGYLIIRNSEAYISKFEIRARLKFGNIYGTVQMAEAEF